MFLSTTNRTKMFHVKHFGTIGPRNRTGARQTLPHGRGGSSNMDRPLSPASAASAL